MTLAINGLLILCLGFVGVQLVTLLGNLVTFPVLKPAAKPAEGARVSLLVPARNEARTLVETLPRLLRQGATENIVEIIVLDDNSTDGTAAVVGRFDDPRLRLVAGAALLEGWNGKNWACQQLADIAHGELLVFTDADVFWESETLGALLAFRARERADFVSVWPRQLTGTLSERIAVPVIDMILLGALPYLGVRYLPFGVFAAGNGQLMAWTRAGYARVGGHAAFKGEVLEDVRMGQQAKTLGLRVSLALGGRMLATRMYRREQEVVEGFSKNILAAHGNSRTLLVVSIILNTLSYSLSLPLALVNRWWLLVTLLGMVQRALTALKTRRSVFEAPLQPLMAYPLVRISLRALRRAGGYTWKGRTYP